MLRTHEHRFAALVPILVCSLLAARTIHAAQSTLLWQSNLESAKQLAAQSNRLVLVHFWSPSCAACKQLEKNVFTSPQVQQAVQARFVPVKINADDWPTTTKQYGISSLPTDLIITPSGQIVGRMISPQTPDAYLQQLAIAANGSTQFAAGPPAAAAMPGAAPATAVNMPAQTAMPSAAPYAAWGAVSANHPTSSTPAVPAYSDNRYAEYFQKYSSAAPPATSQTVPPSMVGAAAPPAVASPTSYAAAPTYNPTAASAPAYSSQVGASGLPSYSPPAVYTPQSPYGAPPASGAPVTAPGYTTPAYGAPASAAPGYAPQSSMSLTTGAITATAPPASPVQQSPAGAVATQTAAAKTTVGNSATAPQLALDGYCPVSLMEEQRWQLGDRRWGVIHRGRTYLFAGPEQQRKFLENPDRYSPAISGQDVVMALDYGQEIDGKRALGVTYQNRIYLFSNDASRQAFERNPKRYATEVLQAENQPATVLR